MKSAVMAITTTTTVRVTTSRERRWNRAPVAARVSGMVAADTAPATTAARPPNMSPATTVSSGYTNVPAVRTAALR